MRLREILEEYKMDADTTRKIIDGVVRLNKQETESQTGVSYSTITRYKEKMANMSKKERNLVIAHLAIENIQESEEQ